MKLLLSAAALACATLSFDALAALSVQRTTTLSDSFGGSLSIATTGSIELPGADTTSQLALSNFHPHDNQELVANGSITRTHERANETATNTYNGSATLIGTSKNGKAVNDTLVLQNVTVTHSGEGREFSGTLVFNGTTIDAAHLTDEAKHALRSVLRLFELD